MSNSMTECHCEDHCCERRFFSMHLLQPTTRKTW